MQVYSVEKDTTQFPKPFSTAKVKIVLSRLGFIATRAPNQPLL